MLPAQRGRLELPALQALWGLPEQRVWCLAQRGRQVLKDRMARQAPRARRAQSRARLGPKEFRDPLDLREPKARLGQSAPLELQGPLAQHCLEPIPAEPRVARPQLIARWVKCGSPLGPVPEEPPLLANY